MCLLGGWLVVWSFGACIKQGARNHFGIYFGWEGQGRLLTLNRLAGNGNGVSMLQLLIMDY